MDITIEQAFLGLPTKIKNKEYFDKNECIKTAYIFVKKVVDYINEAC